MMLGIAMNIVGFTAHTAGGLLNSAMGAASDLAVRKTLILFNVTQASFQMFGVLLESIAKLWEAFWATGGVDFGSTSFEEEPAPALEVPQIDMDVDERERLPFAAPIDDEVIVNNDNDDDDDDDVGEQERPPFVPIDDEIIVNSSNHDGDDDDDDDDAPVSGVEVEMDSRRIMAVKLAVGEFISLAVIRVAAQVPILPEKDEEEQEEKEKDGSADVLLDGGSAAKSSTASSAKRGRKNRKGTSSQGGGTKASNKKNKAKQLSYQFRGVTGAEPIVIEDSTKS